MQGNRIEKPVSELISDLYHREVALIRQEIELAKVEMSINARRAAKYSMLFVLGIGVFLAALVVLLHGIVIALIPFFPPVSSAVIVSFCAGGAGLLLMAIGIYKLSREEFTPRGIGDPEGGGQSGSGTPPLNEQPAELVREETA